MGIKKKHSLRDVKPRRKSYYKSKRKTKKHSRSKKSKSKQIITPYTKKSNCAPNLNSKNYTCYNDESLHKLKVAWGQRHPDDLIKTNDAKEIWTALKFRLQNICKSERCWLNQQFVKSHLDDTLLSYTFAPSSKWTKKNPFEWLNSTDINLVMKQYEKIYPCFAFIGPSPIDFDSQKSHGTCVWEDLCRFSLQTYITKGINKIGMVFNLDPHYKDGSHWVALFINLHRNYIFYFDSNGDTMPKPITELTKRIQQQGREIGMELNISENYPFRHQNSNTECGMYVLYFIINLLKDNHTPEYYKKRKITDSFMKDYRKILFNPDI